MPRLIQNLNPADSLPINMLLRLIAVVGLLLTAQSAFAAHAGDSTMFDVEVRVPDESKKVQRAAFTKGLQQVLIRLSGDEQVLQKLKLPPASRYVKQFRYDMIEPATASVAASMPAQKHTQLWIQFDAEKVETLLRENRIPVWSAQRDGMVIWLAVRDGMQHYLLKRNDESLIKAAADQTATARGLPLVWPLNDAKDSRVVRFADVWAGFQQPLQQASRRYASGPVLAGNLAWNGSGWVSEWTLLDSAKSTQWSFESADYATVVSAALNQIANDLGAHYAVLEDNSDNDATSLRVELKGVESINQFIDAEKLLLTLPAVKDAQLAEVFDDYAVFNVTLRTSTDDFLQRMKRSANVQRLQIPVANIQLTAASDNPPRNEGNTQLVTLQRPAYRFQLGSPRRRN
jgi:hypothetical protein